MQCNCTEPVSVFSLHPGEVQDALLYPERFPAVCTPRFKSHLVQCSPCSLSYRRVAVFQTLIIIIVFSCRRTFTCTISPNPQSWELVLSTTCPGASFSNFSSSPLPPYMFLEHWARYPSFIFSFASICGIIWLVTSVSYLFISSIRTRHMSDLFNSVSPVLITVTSIW